MKKVWITALAKDEEKIGKLMASMKQYGLSADGHFWVDDLQHMAWQQPAEELLKADTALWIIVGTQEDLQAPSVSFGLSLLAMRVLAAKGQAFPVIFAPPADVSGGLDLPTLLRGAEVIALANPSLGVKAVSLANTPLKKIEKDYNLNVHGLPGIGLWFEAGASSGLEWQGALFGGHGGGIDFPRVGPARRGPQRGPPPHAHQGLQGPPPEDEFLSRAGPAPPPTPPPPQFPRP